MGLIQDLLAILSGVAVGVSLGLVGGGGSILAVPLLYYVVKVGTPHQAIGTSSVAVAASAAMSLLGHAREHTVKWPCALAFAAAGVAGAALGAHLGKAIDGERLLALFGVLMIVVGFVMFSPKTAGNNPDVRISVRLVPALAVAGLIVGFVSGFFGIGGGFLIVPGLIGATAMPILNAVGSSLVSVTAFGATTAASYAMSGLVDWWIAVLFVVGGAAGAVAGTRMARHLAGKGRALSSAFAAIVVVAGIAVAARGVATW
jgi:hypothetical protein